MAEIRPCQALLVAAFLLGTPAARADWGFTHWGMTPEQVVGASGGAAHLIAPSARQRVEPNDWELAVEGTISDGALKLDGGFMFDANGGGLTCVVYNAAGDDVEKLRAALVARYGRPLKDGDFGTFRDVTWKTPDDIEFASNKTPPTAAVTHCAPGK